MRASHVLTTSHGRGRHKSGGAQDSGLGGQVLSLRPDTLEDDLLLCSAVVHTGQEYTVRFELDGDDVRCYFARSRFDKE